MRIPTRVYDLTQPLHHNSPVWPGHDLPVVRREFQAVTHGFNAERVTFGTHSATHIDVPFHFIPDGKTLEQVPAAAFAGRAAFLDLRRAVRPDAAITPENLEPHMAGVEKDDIVVLCTGYGQRYGFNAEFLRDYPYLGGPAAELLAEAGVKGVATDAISLGGSGTPEKGRPCHMALLPREIWILEGLFVPDELLDGKKRFFTCFPMLINGCGGAPARAVAYDFD